MASRRFRYITILVALLLLLVSCNYLFSGVIENPEPVLYRVSWQPNSDTIAVSGKNLALYTVGNGSSFSQIEILDREVEQVFGIAWRPDGKQLAEVGEKFRVWDVASQSFVELANQQYLSAVVWSPDGTKLATGRVDGTVQIWDSRTWKLLNSLNGHSQQINTLSWSSDGSKLASGSSDTTVHVWNAETGVNLATLALKTVSVYSAEWRPNSHELALGGSDKYVRIWNVTEQAPENTFPAARDPFWITAVGWSPDGKYMAIASGSTLTTWDGSTSQQLRAFQGHTQIIDSISWKSDGREIASVGKDNTIRIWNSDTGASLGVNTLV